MTSWNVIMEFFYWLGKTSILSAFPDACREPDDERRQQADDGEQQRRRIAEAGVGRQTGIALHVGDELARQLPQATLLVNMSNVAWFGDSLAPAQHLQMAQFRAVETGRMHLTATNTGITAAIDRDGRVLARLPQFTVGRLEIAAQGYSGATPYVRVRDWPAVIASILILAAATLAARRR